MKLSMGLGLIAGLLAGTTVGLLYAPKPGKETRAMLRRLAAHFNERFTPYDAGTRKPVEGIREEP
jgi:gas vesicle protein